MNLLEVKNTKDEAFAHVYLLKCGWSTFVAQAYIKANPEFTAFAAAVERGEDTPDILSGN